MMTSCEDHGFPCQNPNYDKFDAIARGELSNPIEADALVNRSDFCMMIPVDHTLVVGDLDHRLFLKVLRGQSGLYHLWVDYQECSDHGTHTLLCVYVGKGPPEGRITSHIKNKWQSDVLLFATFTAMTNRMSKYYEQLFLDCYDFILNKSEKSGVDELYAVWHEDRYMFGTHSLEVSKLSEIQSLDDL